jgi:hypothetical protein
VKSQDVENHAHGDGACDCYPIFLNFETKLFALKAGLFWLAFGLAACPSSGNADIIDSINHSDPSAFQVPWPVLVCRA